ncbi:MAG: PAS domain-containing protein [Gemmatimonadaceae bacterium]|nr:PAS domain-containing protein [Gemmatimonadaceae bacterium]
MTSSPELFAGPGEMRQRVRDFDWSRTSLGPIHTWPRALRTIVDVALGCAFAQVVLWGPDLIQLYNDAYAEIIGKRHPGVLGEGMRVSWPTHWESSRPHFERILQGETISLHDAPFEFDRDGATTIAYFTASQSPIRGDGGVIEGILATIVETTAGVHTQEMQIDRDRLLEELQQRAAELRASEQRLRELFDQAPVAVAVLEGPDHVYTIASPRYTATPGGGRPLLGRTIREAFPELAGQGFVETMDRVYETGEPYFVNERLVKLDPDGDGIQDERWFNVGYQPLRDASGVVYAVASVTYDITDQMRVRRELEIANQSAENARVEAVTANQAKSAFLTTMSHELRTPLNAVAGYSDLLLMGVRGELTDGQRSDLERIKRSGQYLLGLINDVLNFAKLDAGQVQYRFEDVPVAQLLESLEELIRPQMDAKQLRYERGECESELAVRADPEKVRQVLLNLLANSVKFTEPGGIVSLLCRAESDMMHMTVKDTGRGIAPDQLKRVFDPFVQVDRHLTPMSQQGVGLGLAISRDLANGMGGSLAASSVQGAGSEFTLTLPIARRRAV